MAIYFIYSATVVVVGGLAIFTGSADLSIVSGCVVISSCFVFFDEVISSSSVMIVLPAKSSSPLSLSLVVGAVAFFRLRGVAGFTGVISIVGH